jgi:hypothetical protein
MISLAAKLHSDGQFDVARKRDDHFSIRKYLYACQLNSIELLVSFELLLHFFRLKIIDRYFEDSRRCQTLFSFITAPTHLCEIVRLTIGLFVGKREWSIVPDT